MRCSHGGRRSGRLAPIIVGLTKITFIVPAPLIAHGGLIVTSTTGSSSTRRRRAWIAGSAVYSLRPRPTA